jgi:protein-S-isoprenylcysteine O-methyltransferase Ste14
LGLLDLLSRQGNQNLEKLPDVLLGLSLLGWAVAGMVQSWPDWAAVMPVRLSLALLQAMVGILILLRPAANERGTTRALLLSLPSFLATGILFRLASPLGEWPLGSKWVFAGGVIWVMVCFWSLRGSFAILPARRAIVRGGLYKLVRHPAYLGEYVMAIACAYAGGSIWAWLCLAALLPLLMLRIQQEEDLLRHDADYIAYQAQTRWRLLPWVW